MAGRDFTILSAILFLNFGQPLQINLRLNNNTPLSTVTVTGIPVIKPDLSSQRPFRFFTASRVEPGGAVAASGAGRGGRPGE